MVVASKVLLFAVLLMFLLAFETPVTFTLGAGALVSKTNPDGAFRIIVPSPIFPIAASVSVGPAKGVNVPPVVSAEIVLPPVAGLTELSVKSSFATSPEVCPVAVNSSDAPAYC